MEVNFDFSPTSVAMVGEHLDQALVVLFGGIEVSVNERAAVVIAKAVDDFRILASPRFKATLLFGARDALMAVFGIDGRLEMIGEAKMM